MVGFSQCSLVDQCKCTLFHPKSWMTYLQFFLYQELLTSTRPHLTESSVTLCWLSLLGVACIYSLENKRSFWPQQTLGTDWSQCSSNSSHSLFSSTRCVFTSSISRQDSGTSPICPLIAERIAHIPAEDLSSLQEFPKKGKVGLSTSL